MHGDCWEYRWHCDERDGLRHCRYFGDRKRSHVIGGIRTIVHGTIYTLVGDSVCIKASALTSRGVMDKRVCIIVTPVVLMQTWIF